LIAALLEMNFDDAAFDKIIQDISFFTRPKTSITGKRLCTSEDKQWTEEEKKKHLLQTRSKLQLQLEDERTILEEDKFLWPACFPNCHNRWRQSVVIHLE
jgi:hypothetical protein